MTAVDELVGLALAQSDLENGADPEYLAKNGRLNPISSMKQQEGRARSPEWTKEEDKFLRDGI